MIGGWTRKILRVDLTAGTAEIDDLETQLREETR